ncbi:hypothetical protein RRG08_030272 [Elysia crispata]|uniref:Uncharacterized protein n=1 Tax=Elysia crispata TaxID=231223 RepID=A0AAE1DXZ0_9GAST|nr:hypothetical protein RRG08_030272 [Elysia crispata]
MLVKGKPLAFLIDTGASVNILPERYATHLVGSRVKTLRSYCDTAIETKGTSRQVIINLRNNKKYAVDFVMVPNSCQPVIGLKAAQRMQLVQIKKENFETVASLIESSIFDEGLASSPAQRLMGRRTQSLTPATSAALQPFIVPQCESHKMEHRRHKSAQRTCFKQTLAPLQPGNHVRMEPIDGRNEWKPATLQLACTQTERAEPHQDHLVDEDLSASQVSSPRSSSAKILGPSLESTPTAQKGAQAAWSSRGVTGATRPLQTGPTLPKMIQTRSGRFIKEPSRLSY